MKSNTGKVLIAAPVHPVLTDGLKAAGYECVVMEQITQAGAYTAIADCAGVITSTRLQLDKELLDAAAELKWIGRMGSGMEVVDTVYAAAKGILCYSSPEGNCNAVGEHALGMLLGLTRRISWSHQEMQQGLWHREENRGIELENRTIGIIGFGHTGRALAKKLLGFDMRILVYDKYNSSNFPAYARQCGLRELMQEADIISFHVPLQEDTIHYFSESFITDMSKPFILVNTSRGKVVDLRALYSGLLSGKVTGACLDVFEREPFYKMDDELRDIFDEMINMPNVVATPHIAGYTFEALYKMSRVLIGKIVP